MGGVVPDRTAEAVSRAQAAIAEHARLVDDFPAPGIAFKDLTPVLADPEGLSTIVTALTYGCSSIDLVAGIDARGFLLGGAVARELEVGVLAVRKGGKLPAGRDLSPVARALVAFGERAASYTASLLGSAHPDVRFYAILIAAELVHPDLTDAVAERIHDEDEGVRRLAVQLLPRFASFRGFDEVRTVVRRTARLRGKDPSRRLQAIDAVAALHDVEMIPKLIEHLKDHDDDLVEHAHRALVAITGNDVGATHRKWSSWWEKNRARHRIEWLIDGLGHTDEKVRRHAGEELQRATQQYYGYHPGSPKRDRDLVAKRYRQWWDREGQRRFA